MLVGPAGKPSDHAVALAEASYRIISQRSHRRPSCRIGLLLRCRLPSSPNARAVGTMRLALPRRGTKGITHREHSLQRRLGQPLTPLHQEPQPVMEAARSAPVACGRRAMGGEYRNGLDGKWWARSNEGGWEAHKWVGGASGQTESEIPVITPRVNERPHHIPPYPTISHHIPLGSHLASMRDARSDSNSSRSMSSPNIVRTSSIRRLKRRSTCKGERGRWGRCGVMRAAVP